MSIDEKMNLIDLRHLMLCPKNSLKLGYISWKPPVPIKAGHEKSLIGGKRSSFRVS